MLLRGEKVSKIPTPYLKINYGEIMAFPEQGEEGWRRYAFLTLFTPGKPLVEKGSMFAKLIGRARRGQGEASMGWEHIGSVEKAERALEATVRRIKKGRK
jgi:hypothetical protein